jgi:hypothetical protein
VKEENKRPMFHFSIAADISLSVEEIWPDGDAPENPTIEDVLEVIAKCGGRMRVIRDWNLHHELTMDVSGPGRVHRSDCADVP